MTAPSLFDSLWRDGHLRTIDHALATSLRRLDPSTPDAVLAAAALASLAVAKGHAGLKLIAARDLFDEPTAIAWPDADDWRATLSVSRWVSTPADSTAIAASDTPLVLEGDLLYLRRYREYERALAHGLQRIASSVVPQHDVAPLSPLFAQLFPPVDQKASAPTLLPLAGEGARRADEGMLPGPNPHPNPLPQAGEGAQHDHQAPASSLLPPAGEGARRADEGMLPATNPPPQASQPTQPNHQARAAALALQHTLLLVTGGPGTGKTTTVARLLVLLAAQALHVNTPAPRIALAAPTGRAAERMAESVRNAMQAPSVAGIAPALLATLPTTGNTLHRLLGTIPDLPRFRHNADNPLPFDVVVVDEASMIDLPLMAKLVAAVADGARLILLGDPDQLPSVEAGDVLAAILQAAGDGLQLAPEDADALQPLLGDAPTPRRPRESGDPRTLPSHPQAAHMHTSMDPRMREDDEFKNTSPANGRGRAAGAGEDVLPEADIATTFPGRRVHLVRGWRQSESLDLAPLATAVREGDTATALSLLRSGQLSGVHFHDNLADPLQAHRDALLAHWQSLADAATPADALARANRLRILTAVREGPQGAHTLNARIETLLSENGLGHRRRGQRHFHGQLLIVTENSYRHRLFNGDIGICHRDADDSLMAWFPGDDPVQPRAFHPAALPAHDSAFAMTVHKAQGSEFDAVWLVLPERFNRVLSRELVYTGLTRARSQLHLAANETVLREALSRHASRWSGLGWRLSPEAAR